MDHSRKRYNKVKNVNRRNDYFQANENVKRKDLLFFSSHNNKNFENVFVNTFTL